MKLIRCSGRRTLFEVLATTRRGQAAMMTLPSGGVSDDEPSNEHPRSEQWLYVISGTGAVRIGRSKTKLHSVKLNAGSLLVIERGELHQIRNTGRRPLRTINFYLPPAYTADGDLIAAE